MVKLPRKVKRLLIEEVIEDRKIKQDFRPHLGASEIGDICLRKVWLSFRWSKERFITRKQERLFNRGHMEELILAYDLINAGCKVEGVDIDESIKRLFKVALNHDLPEQKQHSAKFAYGFGGASSDGLIYKLPDAKKTPHLLECKALNLKGIEKLKRSKLEKGNFRYYVQIQIYMHLFKLKRCLFVAVHKDSDERYYERVKYNKSVALEYIERAEKVILNINVGFPVLNQERFPCYWKNKTTGVQGWCDYFDICYQGKQPFKNCRTCKDFGLRGDKEKLDGYFLCEKTGKKLKHKKQLKGCNKYKPDIVFSK